MLYESHWLTKAKEPGANRAALRKQHLDTVYNIAARDFDLAMFDVDHPGLRAALATVRSRDAKDLLSKINAGMTMTDRQIGYAKHLAFGH